MPLDESTFLSELREPKPDPGGGSASAFALADGFMELAAKECHGSPN
jgi:formiminotetrahydrofolate cyclodeaminase